MVCQQHRAPLRERSISSLRSDLGTENSTYFPEILFQLRAAGLATLCHIALGAFPPALPQSLLAGIETCPCEHLVQIPVCARPPRAWSPCPAGFVQVFSGPAPKVLLAHPASFPRQERAGLDPKHCVCSENSRLHHHELCHASDEKLLCGFHPLKPPGSLNRCPWPAFLTPLIPAQMNWHE